MVSREKVAVLKQCLLKKHNSSVKKVALKKVAALKKLLKKVAVRQYFV